MKKKKIKCARKGKKNQKQHRVAPIIPTATDPGHKKISDTIEAQTSFFSLFLLWFDSVFGKTEGEEESPIQKSI